MKTGLLEDTYDLVKSLSRTEKRYFKLFTRFQQGDKSYIKLFDLLDKQAGFDEKAISRQFLAKNNVTNYPSVKKYLFDQIIASIKSYGAYKDLDSDHTDLIETYKVLHYKGLRGQSHRLLMKVKKLTLEDDAFARHFLVLLMEYYKEMYNADGTNSDGVIKILGEFRSTLDIIDNYSRVANTFILMRLHLRKKLYCRNAKDKEELTKVISPLLNTADSDMLSRTALSMRKMALCDYYLAIGEPEQAFETSKIYLQLRNNAGNNDKLDIITIGEYFQHSMICIRSGIFEDFDLNMVKYKSIIDKVRNKEKYFIAYERWHNSMLMYYNRIGQFEQAEVFLENEQTISGDLVGNFSKKAQISCWYAIAYNQFALKKHKTALKWIQKLMNNAEVEEEEYSFAKMLLMFIHYDLKNYELLEYQVRSAERIMKKAERLYNCEKLVLEFFRMVSGGDTKKVRIKQISQLQNDLATLFENKYERWFSFYFDIESWIESELSNQDFARVVRK